MRILGVVIAGGLSTRMGGKEKAFLTLGHATLIERVISRIRFQVHDIIINANGDAGRFVNFGVKVIPDTVADIQTPLAGLHAAIAYGQKAAFDAVLTVPSDAPFLPLDLVQRLEEEGRGTGAAIAASLGQQHYLTGLWSTALAPVLDQAIRKQGLRRVQDFVKKVETGEAEWFPLPHDPFFNVNTPEDLTQAEKLVSEED
jgi:molybdenum cofactor guanylyltransferase